MPTCAQRSPSEALSPSVGPRGTARPPSAATSGSVPSYTGRPGRPQSAWAFPGAVSGRSGRRVWVPAVVRNPWNRYRQTGADVDFCVFEREVGWCRMQVDREFRFRSRGVRDDIPREESVRRST
ncbi:hypothetical protein EASAB2608_02633 [Streptomyces sp. EAS-AB2608]|uniref:Uncharacterized protein n=1 Tax=Streptomyces bangladeshensis TaxID=295352 RepID=A0ABN1ZL82_9ACTN|nr:hypothetical protein EASAB2608_02633 [Streptomyces sp. EAS-AB2608]